MKQFKSKGVKKVGDINRLSNTLKDTYIKKIKPVEKEPLTSSMFDDDEVKAKRGALNENEAMSDLLIGKKRMFGDGMGSHYLPNKLLHVNKVDKWIASRMKLTKKQKEEKNKQNNDLRLGRPVQEKKLNEKAV